MDIWKRIGLNLLLAGALLAVSGCGRDSGGGPAVVVHPKPRSTTAPGSGVFAVDCNRKLTYVPLDTGDVNGDGQVAVINLGADPDVSDPRLATISLTHKDFPLGTALDNDHSLIIVVSGQTAGQDGSVDLIDETTNQLVAGSPFPFPTGSQSGFFGQVLYDPTTHLAVIATCDSATCSSGNALTGFVTFDPITHVFGTIIPANYAEAFALNDKTGVVIDGSDDDSTGAIGATDLAGGRTCTLSDTNIDSDNDGSSLDNTTNIAVVSNEANNATVINLKGSSFAPASGTPCTLNEGGTPPNSVLVSGLPAGTAGSAVDAANHWAFLIADGVNGMALLTLPTAPVTQLVSGDITTVSSAFPNDPQANTWGTKGDPYAVAVGNCANLPHKGFAINDSFTFLAEVDLPTLHTNPGVIPTAPPAGHCAGTTSTVTQCNNGNGVIFFPLPGVL